MNTVTAFASLYEDIQHINITRVAQLIVFVGSTGSFAEDPDAKNDSVN